MKNGNSKKKGEAGFSLVEVTIAMVILLVGLLGVSLTYTSVVRYNAGNNLRLQSLAVLQQEIEQLRSAKFTPTLCDARLLGGIKDVKSVTPIEGGNTFQVQVIVDDDPFTNGVQTDTSKTLKEISITVTSENQAQGWAGIPSKVTLRRVRSN